MLPLNSSYKEEMQVSLVLQYLINAKRQQKIEIFFQFSLNPFSNPFFLRKIVL